MPSLSIVTLILIMITRQNIRTPERLNLDYQNRNYTLGASDINFTYGFNPEVKAGKLYPRLDNIVSINFDKDRLSNFTLEIDKDINKEPVEAKFEFKGGKIQEFQLSENGLLVEDEKLYNLIVNSFVGNNNAINIPVKVVRPKVSTDDIDNLGIKEQIGEGKSTYYHSISSRIHNVVLAASRINGTLVAPNETFSFNETLGDVSEFTGYQQAYIISGGKTILGDGGGVCQVSTTLFRALLNAGLPITERRAHAYRVGYYEQDSPPGLDATVYSPSPDLKFKNDTGKYILIEARADPKKYTLTFDLYGTSDGRVATITKPIVTDIVPAPEPLYQDDPTLPTGTTKQIDFAAKGAKVTFNYKVTRGRETLISRAFVSLYRPWQAIYIKGTGSIN